MYLALYAVFSSSNITLTFCLFLSLAVVSFISFLLSDLSQFAGPEKGNEGDIISVFERRLSTDSLKLSLFLSLTFSFPCFSSFSYLIQFEDIISILRLVWAMNIFSLYLFLYLFSLWAISILGLKKGKEEDITSVFELGLSKDTLKLLTGCHTGKPVPSRFVVGFTMLSA